MGKFFILCSRQGCWGTRIIIRRKRRKNKRSRAHARTHAYMCNSSGRERRKVANHFFTINYIPRQGEGVTFQTAASVALFPRLDIAFTKLNEIKPIHSRWVRREEITRRNSYYQLTLLAVIDKFIKYFLYPYFMLKIEIIFFYRNLYRKKNIFFSQRDFKIKDIMPQRRKIHFRIKRSPFKTEKNFPLSLSLSPFIFIYVWLLFKIIRSETALMSPQS